MSRKSRRLRSILRRTEETVRQLLSSLAESVQGEHATRNALHAVSLENEKLRMQLRRFLPRSSVEVDEREGAYALRILVPIQTIKQAVDVRGLIDSEISRMRDQLYEVVAQRHGRNT